MTSRVSRSEKRPANKPALSAAMVLPSALRMSQIRSRNAVTSGSGRRRVSVSLPSASTMITIRSAGCAAAVTMSCGWIKPSVRSRRVFSNNSRSGGV